MRAVAAADASTARILDGHLNGVERLALRAPEPELLQRELAAVARGELLLGVWGADPAPGRGRAGAAARDGRADAARREDVLLRRRRRAARARDRSRRRRATAPRVAYVDLSQRSQRSTGPGIAPRACALPRAIASSSTMLPCSRCSAARRARCASRGSRATRCAPRRPGPGIADRILQATVAALRVSARRRVQAARARPDARRASDDRPLARSRLRGCTGCRRRPGGGRRATQRSSTTPRLPWNAAVGECADAARSISTEAAARCGSRALVVGGALDRARRDLDLFLLQHRLDPKLVELGARRSRRRGGAMTAVSDARRARALRAHIRDQRGSLGLPHQQLRARQVRGDARRASATALSSSALEVGCSIGVFTRLLATRCERSSRSTSRAALRSPARSTLAGSRTSSCATRAFPSRRRRASGIWWSARRFSTTSTSRRSPSDRLALSALQQREPACSRSAGAARERRSR